MSIPPEFYQIPTEHRIRLRQAIDHVLGQGYNLTQQRVVTECVHFSIPVATVRNVVRWAKAGDLDGVDWAETPQVAQSVEVFQADASPEVVEIPLVQAIREAKSYDDLKELGLLVTAELARDNITPAAARAFQGLLGETRQVLKAQLAVEPDAVAEAIVLVSEPASQMAKTYEYIVSDARRQNCLDFVELQFQEDLLENPNQDLAHSDG